MNQLKLFLAAITFTLLSGCCTPDPNLGSQAMTSVDQHQSNWCWAASGQMTMNFLGGSVTECDEANKRFSRSDCCNSPTPSACNNGGWPEFDKYGFKADHTSDAALSWDDVKKQIFCHKVPFCNAWHWNGGGGHMMVISGYMVLNNVNYVYLRDPLPVGVGSSRWITYDAYVSGAGYTHWDDYYNIAKK
ncbi:MAG: papain-like cysteine protease family protein [Ginsengibacter sp.]